MTGGNGWTFGPNEIFTFFFIMLGPIKLLAPFAKLSAGLERPARRALALRGAGIATLTILAASFLGSALVVKWQLTPGALAIAGGVLFFLVAIGLVLDGYTERPAADAPQHEPAKMRALVRLLVPKIVTPYGIAAVILILALQPDATLAVVEILIGIMLLDLIAMLLARRVLAVLGFALQIAGTVMGVLQVALSVQMIVYGVKLVAVQSFGFAAR